jgi:hypothetical protein
MGEMADHPGVDRITAEYRAFSTGDYGALARMLAPAAVWHVSGTAPRSGDKPGRDEILAFLEDVARDTHENFMIELHDVLANDRHTVVLAHVTAVRDGGIYTADEIHIFNTDDQGRITEAWGFTADPAGQGSFWF